MGSLQVVTASFISAFTAAWSIKEKLKYDIYFLFPSLTYVFVPELDIIIISLFILG